jgi:large subunit ribosomal protein L13
MQGTYTASPSEIERSWFIVDAANKPVGRLASDIARVLRGKHKPTFTPHIDTGDFVVVVNAEKVAFTGSKLTKKEYYRFSGFAGGLRRRTAAAMLQHDPAHPIEHAVHGMLPKGPLGRAMIKKLKVYAGTEHPHAAQQPKSLPSDF